jgi:protein involved in polysaccharide export with SLBB domain
VKIIQPKIRYASVIGEVKRPGTYTLENDETIFHLLARAGGLTEYADHDSIYIIREKDNLKRIRFKFNDLNTGEPQLIFFPIEDGDILFAE